MKKLTQEQLNKIVVCPVCGEKRMYGHMMAGTDKPICKYCYRKKGEVIEAKCWKYKLLKPFYKPDHTPICCVGCKYAENNTCTRIPKKGGAK